MARNREYEWDALPVFVFVERSFNVYRRVKTQKEKYFISNI